MSSKYTCLYATGLSHLSLLRNEEGKFAEAEEIIRESLRIKTTHLGYNHLHVALLYINLAIILYEKETHYASNSVEGIVNEAISILKSNDIPSSHPVLEKMILIQKDISTTKRSLQELMSEYFSPLHNKQLK